MAADLQCGRAAGPAGSAVSGAADHEGQADDGAVAAGNGAGFKPGAIAIADRKALADVGQADAATVQSPLVGFLSGTAGLGHWLLQTVRPISLDKAIVEIVVFGPKGEPAEVRQERLRTALDFQTSAGKISGDDTEAARRCAGGFGAYPHVQWSNMDRGQAPGDVGHKNDEYSLRAFRASGVRNCGGT